MSGGVAAPVIVTVPSVATGRESLAKAGMTAATEPEMSRVICWQSGLEKTRLTSKK